MFNEHCSWKTWRLDNQKFYFHGSWMLVGCPILTTLTAILQKKQNAGGKKTRLWRVLGRECTNAWWSINTPVPRGVIFQCIFQSFRHNRSWPKSWMAIFGVIVASDRAARWPTKDFNARQNGAAGDWYILSGGRWVLVLVDISAETLWSVTAIWCSSGDSGCHCKTPAHSIHKPPSHHLPPTSTTQRKSTKMTVHGGWL